MEEAIVLPLPSSGDVWERYNSPKFTILDGFLQDCYFVMPQFKQQTQLFNIMVTVHGNLISAVMNMGISADILT